MMAADLLHVAVPLTVPSGMSSHWPLSCRRACSASAFAPHFALSSAQPSSVQASCLERARPAALSTSICAFAGGLAASSAAPPGRRRPERQRGAKAEGKTKGRGTGPRRKPVCTWGEHGTELLCHRAVFGAKVAPMQACRRASHDRTRQSLQGERR
ncbi:hypothetical protein EJ607_16625 [Pseudomonas aeruginosa]|nr:hypothetical protein EJ607_16625 [Pseudomonas aeruginosa]